MGEWAANPVPRLQDGRIAEHISCARCGYDLYSLEAGAACPECGAAGEYDRHWRQRRVVRRGALAALILACAALVPNLGFRALLAIRGVRLMDLWGSGQIRPLDPQAARLVIPGQLLAYAMLWALPALCLLILLAAGAAVRYRDRPSGRLVIWAGIMVVLIASLSVTSCAVLAGL